MQPDTNLEPLLSLAHFLGPYKQSKNRRKIKDGRSKQVPRFYIRPAKSKARGVVKKNRSKYEYYCSNVRPGSANWWHQRMGRVAV